MHHLIFLCLVVSSFACRQYVDDDNNPIDLGCVAGIGGLEPWEPTKINTLFVVHDQDHVANPERVYLWNASLDSNDAMFHPDDKLQLIIHGFAASSRKAWVQKLKGAFLKRDYHTKVLLVDWSDGAAERKTKDGTSFRPQAASNALMVGRIVACFIQRIMSTYGIRESSVDIFGHSLGGQAMGRAVAWLSDRFGIRIGTAIASEASAQPFRSEGIYPEKEDVHFMLAMHTASSTPSFEHNDAARGLYEAFADVDLYANRGILVQPACRMNNFSLCSHEQAYVFLTEMIAECNENCDFRGFVCENEQDAVNGTCSNKTVEVCSLIRNHEAIEKPSDRRGIVLTFETYLDQLPFECRSRR